MSTAPYGQVYCMCLLHWGRVLSTKEHKSLAKAATNSETPTSSGWWHEQKDCTIPIPGVPGVPGVAKDVLYGFYHSRLIFRFVLKEEIKNVGGLRETREAIELWAKAVAVGLVLRGKGPKAVFMYSVFELKSSSFWKTNPDDELFTMQTTCFYTELTDPDRTRLLEFVRPPGWLLKLKWLLKLVWPLKWLLKLVWPASVKLRISGGSTVTSKMSPEFRWRLVNVVYHEGLYRESRREASRTVHVGLESRLEKFADQVISSFSQSLSNEMLTRLTGFLVSLTVVLLILTVVLVVRSLTP